MKKLIFIVLTIIFSIPALSQDINFDDYFVDKTMRIDYFQTGNAEEEIYSIDQIYQYDTWGGNPKKLIDEMNSGMYYLHIYDLGSNKLIYSRGFQTIFGEYRTTGPAKNGAHKTYHETVLFPYPKASVLMVINGRDEHNMLIPLFSYKIDPKDVNIIKETSSTEDKVIEVFTNGNPHDMVDIVFIAEGYTSDKLDKFTNDVQHFTAVMFNTEPFKSYKNKFNVSGIFRPSLENRVDEPTKGLFSNTVVDASYNALNLPRYLLIDDNKSLRDIASGQPYDYVIILSNTDRYGGGGIYNNYTIFTADDERSEGILMHEFGHGFANLADEYFGSTVSYNEFFPPGREPHEPNITRLLDPDNPKWKHIMDPDIPVPAYWGQDGNDSIRKHYQNLYQGKVGVFEGAGYSPKGIYRSEVKIGFFSDGAYNRVSTEAIKQMIEHLSN
jgi:hypothetical protein